MARLVEIGKHLHNHTIGLLVFSFETFAGQQQFIPLIFDATQKCNCS
jgi:hypothetical protein